MQTTKLICHTPARKSKPRIPCSPMYSRASSIVRKPSFTDSSEETCQKKDNNLRHLNLCSLCEPLNAPFSNQWKWGKWYPLTTLWGVSSPVDNRSWGDLRRHNLTHTHTEPKDRNKQQRRSVLTYHVFWRRLTTHSHHKSKTRRVRHRWWSVDKAWVVPRAQFTAGLFIF